MKFLSITGLFFACLLAPFAGNTQDSKIQPPVKHEEKLWVIAESDFQITSFKPVKSKQPTIENLFNKYQVTSYEPALMGAKSDKLKRLYEITCDCDAEVMAEEIKTKYKSDFSAVKVVEPDLQVSVYDPVDYMWAAYANTWLWHLKRIEADKAWDITRGDPSVYIAILDTDFDPTHPDLATKMISYYDPYDNGLYDCTVPASMWHGIAVASFAAGETTEIGDTPNGQLASVGFNTKFLGYKAWSGNYLQRAYHASLVMGAKIVTSSAGGWSTCPDLSGIDEAIVKDILDNGTAIIMPAGNGVNGTHNFCASVDPVNHCAFFPLSPYYDERVILVSGTGPDDNHAYVDGSGNNYTHSHYPDVDLCAPGHELMGAMPTNCVDGGWPYYGSLGGTSFATPIVAGTAALMYSINPCLTPSLCQDILKNTTDPILDAASFPGMVGTGRLNAYKAVVAAQATHSTTLDLYIKDRPEDLGREDFPYHWQADRDESPDIWVRNQQDGFTNQTHQNPEYNGSAPVWVYVRVRNKSCVASTGGELLSVYWSKASSWSSWPQNWDGSQPTIGDVIGSVNIPVLAPGEETIIELQWTIINPYINNNWGSCVMARIENSTVDDIVIHPNRLDDDVFFNNNVALRNVTIIDVVPGIKPHPYADLLKQYPDGNFVYVGNPTETEQILDISFGVDEAFLNQHVDQSIESLLIFDDAGWRLLSEYFKKSGNVKVVAEKIILVSGDQFRIDNIPFPKGARFPVFIGFRMKDNAPISKAKFHIRQYLSKDRSLLGGVHMTVQKKDNPGNPNSNSVLNVVSDKLNKIIRLTPNPADYDVVAEIKVEQGRKAQLLILDEMGSHQKLYDVQPGVSKIKIDLSSFGKGKYQVVLIVDGMPTDSKLLLIEKK